ncbi:carbohydrate porin [Methylorubrum rhodesianum]|uniref:carbohydrate porin n=1 Tax=Methylorubrum rhodesianum TaxID=29427 RepID=UPI0037459791
MNYFAAPGFFNTASAAGLRVFRNRRVLFCRFMAIAFYLLALGIVAILQIAKAHAQELQTTADRPDAQPIPATPTKLPEASRESSAKTNKVDWSGIYFGGHTGFGTGDLGPGTNAILNQSVGLPPTVTGMIGGLQGGYNFQPGDGWVLGTEADITFVSPPDETRRTAAPFNTTLDAMGTVRARIGYAFGPFLPYATGGFAWARTKVDINGDDGAVLSKLRRWHAGWTAGVGIEMALGGPWTARAEYDYLDLASSIYRLDGTGLRDVSVHPQVQRITFGLNYRLGDGVSALAKPSATGEASPDWNVHGQTTFIAQGYPAIRSPYASANSLPGGGQLRETWTADAFLGVRLWEGGEFYFNPELAQGFGLNGTLGLAGFPNGEAQKGGTEFPKFRAQRYYVRQTFGLGGEQEDVADGPLQLAGRRDINRITVTVGRFAVGDFFDANAYAKDPRADFMNWAIWSSGAYDFPADLPGFTRGAVIELNQKNWAVRAGAFQVPEQPNSDVLVFKGGGGGVVEFEERHSLFGQPGKVRIGTFVNRGRTGAYRDAIDIAQASPQTDINDAMTALRRNQNKYGFYGNIEQALTADLGLFARASWNDGRTEILSFTDIDRSISGGFALKGTAWGRPSDTIGLGAAVNGLSRAHRDFLAAGGTGLLIGDGRLRYGHESIVEAYYALRFNDWSAVTFDYQFVANPAYNADRGPASILSLRAHAEF